MDNAQQAQIAPGQLITLKQTSQLVLRAKPRKERPKVKETAVPILAADKTPEAHPLEATPRNEAVQSLGVVMVAKALVVARLVQRNAEACHLAKDVGRTLTSQLTAYDS